MYQIFQGDAENAQEKYVQNDSVEYMAGNSMPISMVEPIALVVAGKTEVVISRENDTGKLMASREYGEAKYVERLIDELNETHAVIDIGGKCKVMKLFTDPDTELEDFTLSSPNDFRGFYCNRKVKTDEGYLPLGVVWFNHPRRREFKGLTFSPRVTPVGYFNMWHGHAVEPREGDCSKYLAHVRDVIASGNKVIYEYLIGWMAHCIQKPDELIGVAIALRGSMGTGKGVFANGFGSLFGRHFMPLTQGAQLTGKFNSHMKDKVLVFADEAFWAGDKQAEGVLKALITEPSLVIEGKGENAFSIKNHLHFIFATNNDWVAPAGPQERRFFVLDVSEEKMQNHEYFAAIQRELDSGGREALLYYLQNYNLAGKNLRQFPQTAALLEQKLYSLTPVQKYWYAKLEAGSLPNCQGWDDIPKKELHYDFVRFCNDSGIRHKANDSEFGSQLKKLVPNMSTGKGRTGIYGTTRPNVYKFPSLHDCREVFCIFINYPIAWPICDETQAS